jgi:hypothetical protein
MGVFPVDCGGSELPDAHAVEGAGADWQEGLAATGFGRVVTRETASWFCLSRLGSAVCASTYQCDVKNRKRRCSIFHLFQDKYICTNAFG